MSEIEKLLTLLRVEIEDCQVGTENDAEIEDALYTFNKLETLVLNKS